MSSHGFLIADLIYSIRADGKSTPSRTWPSEPDEESKTEGGMKQRPKRNKREGIRQKKCVTISLNNSKANKVTIMITIKSTPLLPHNFIICTAGNSGWVHSLHWNFFPPSNKSNNQTRGAIKMNNNLTENWCSHDDSENQQHETTTEWRHRYSQTAVTQQDTSRHTHNQ